jgi:hypothetical protein
VAAISRPARPADDRRASPQSVRCARCSAAVLVAKFSPQHTSVQWTAASAASCPEFAARAAVGAGVAAGTDTGARAGTSTSAAPIEACGALRDSIDAAVASGALAVCPPSYE